jgi:hypothetical protein
MLTWVTVIAIVCLLLWITLANRAINDLQARVAVLERQMARMMRGHFENVIEGLLDDLREKEGSA